MIRKFTYYYCIACHLSFAKQMISSLIEFNKLMTQSQSPSLSSLEQS